MNEVSAERKNIHFVFARTDIFPSPMERIILIFMRIFNFNKGNFRKYRLSYRKSPSVYALFSKRRPFPDEEKNKPKRNSGLPEPLLRTVSQKNNAVPKKIG
jgi:hypothetical protein